MGTHSTNNCNGKGNGQDITDGDATPSTTDGTDYGSVIVNTTTPFFFSGEQYRFYCFDNSSVNLRNRMHQTFR
jgi:hypothetical protein